MARPLLFLLLLGWYLAVAGPARAQAPLSKQLDSLQAAYPFLHTSANHIENATIGLQGFYQKLLQLPLHPARLPGGRVAVVHLGDSHLQADDYSGRVRQELQRTYGNAGRGLVFPYGVAHTNGSPTYFTTATGGTWRTRRVTNLPDSSLPVGVAGLSLATADSGAGFALRLPQQRLLLRHRPTDCFSQLTLLRQPGPAAFDWQVLGRQGQVLGTVPGLGRGVATTVRLDSLRDFVALRTTRRRPNQSSAQLYGLVLENDQPGILYHGIGVNGAAVRQYNRNPLFFEQLPVLSPDLFIISLGTNDAFSPGFNPVRFAGQLDTLVSGLRQRCPTAELLLVAPADSYRHRRDRNPDLARLAAVLRTYAQQHDLAYWDFAAVQGGYGSMGQWRASGLALNDFVHFSTKGYDLQALLLYLALQDGFAAFLHR
ncbi:GDSL-type esterase/lipase family protein [Hymenobacter sp. H14-R3]|uniref:GDSL-type esterase/lipase family protein n=1 Tax=Hymenobacter sp. H14-R3 TaxID=3046308 RepID=UPI0024BAC014|nr:GDSL-type esterase/lipase family protein [Hymenobacter sp. H14-R3]MDJ0364118.1 GDSL-type esterase/lipase family protein [Hymenobacter sp. H14-R3]